MKLILAADGLKWNKKGGEKMNFRIIVYLCLVIVALLSISFGIEGKVVYNAGTGIAVSFALIAFFIAGYFIGRQDEGEANAKAEKIYTEHM